MAESEQVDSRLKSSVERFRKELDHWLDIAQNQSDKALGVFGLQRSSAPFYPRVDLLETPEEIVVLVELPGIDPNAVDVTIAGNMLTIKGDIEEFVAGEDGTVHLRERSSGSFTRSIPMPSSVDAEQVRAESKNGVLTVRLSKSERTKAKQVSVKSD